MTEEHLTPTVDTVEAVVRAQISRALGGRRGMVEAAVPTLIFTVVWLTTKELRYALVASVTGARIAAAGLGTLSSRTRRG